MCDSQHRGRTNLGKDGDLTVPHKIQSEVAPPRIRGLLAGMQQWMLGWGFVVAVSLAFGP
jgi:hypothetical protein